MLLSLSIRNFILIDSIDLELSNGFTVITGETGAGKSILIDSLLCVLGERVSGDLLKHDTDKGYVEAVFDVSSNKTIPDLLLKEGYDASAELIIRREFNSKGVNRCFLNDSPATASFVRTIGNELIDFHGQHEHQTLLKSEFHIDFLDSYANNHYDKMEYCKEWEKTKTAKSDLQQLINQKYELQKHRESTAFLLNEIEEIQPKSGELEKIEKDIHKAMHSAKIVQSAITIKDLLAESEHSVHDLLSKTKMILEQLSEVDDTFNQYIQECNSAIASVNEISLSVSDYINSDDVTIDNLDLLQERASKLLWLKKKYGSIDAAIQEWEIYKDKLRLTDNVDDEISTLEQAYKESCLRLGKKGKVLTAKRLKAAKDLSPKVCSMLESMGIAKPTFEILIKQSSVISNEDLPIAIIDDVRFIANRKGVDSVEFAISTNPGESTKPLAKVASGGEISRIMLALKSIIADNDTIPTMVFDEIDTGISGKVSRKVGFIMKSLGLHRQIIAITHSPQIASLADCHIQVKKTVHKQSTSVTATILGFEDRIQEIASLLSGTSTTKSTKESARELIEANDHNS